MDLRSFIKAALLDICQGVAEAQAEEGGSDINARGVAMTGGHLIDTGSYGIFTRVDFDVAVSAETEGGGKGGLKVFGVGAEGGVQHTTGTTNRLTFSVPVRLPSGDQTRYQQVKAQSRGYSQAETDFDPFR